MRRAAWAVIVALLLAAPAAADAFDDALEAALVHWRAAVWYARTGNTGVAALESEELRAGWAALRKAYEAPPPVFARDAGWSATLARVDELAGRAVRAFESDDAAAGAAALRGIGDLLSELRARNGVTGFSDLVARYRDSVERLSGLMPDERIEPSRAAALRTEVVRTRAAVEAMAAAPARWRGTAAFEAALRQNRDDLDALAAALARPDADLNGLEILGLIRVVRSNYNLLFLRYGAAAAAATG